MTKVIAPAIGSSAPVRDAVDVDAKEALACGETPSDLMPDLHTLMRIGPDEDECDGGGGKDEVNEPVPLALR